jgi:hypothetical protein
MQCKMRYVVNGGVVYTGGKANKRAESGGLCWRRASDRAGCRALDAEGAAGADPGKLD